MTIYFPLTEEIVRQRWDEVQREWDDLSFIQYRRCVRCNQKGHMDSTYDDHLRKYPECLMASIHSQ